MSNWLWWHGCALILWPDICQRQPTVFDESACSGLHLPRQAALA